MFIVPRKKPKSARGYSNRFRIVSGEWRGRRLPFPEVDGLRPTPDRVRETVFNWLGPRCVGAEVLDLCAGSGALGLEAASRGAARVDLVEASPPLVATLREHIATLGAGPSVRAHQADAQEFLRGPVHPYTLVFMDPPYASGLLEPLTAALAQGWLAPGARVYLEAPASAGPPPLPVGWTLLKEGRAGQVGYYLACSTE